MGIKRCSSSDIGKKPIGQLGGKRGGSLDQGVKVLGRKGKMMKERTMTTSPYLFKLLGVHMHLLSYTTFSFKD